MYIYYYYVHILILLLLLFVVITIVVTLVNAIRRNNSLPPVGFLNQVLYSKKAYKKFNDVTSGINSCCAYSGSQTTASSATCCVAGFQSAVGWDPVTGWGSINFPLFSGLFNQSIAYVKSNATNADSNLLTSLFYAYEWYIIAGIVLIALFIFGCLWNHCCSKKPYRPWERRQEEQQQQHQSCCLCCACPSSRPPANQQQSLYRPSTLEMNASMQQRPADGLTDEERVMIAQSELYDKAANRKSKFIGSHPQSPPRSPPPPSQATAPSAPELDYSQPETWSLWDTEVAMLVDMGFGTLSPRQVQPILAKYLRVPVSMNPASRGRPNEQNFQRVIDTIVNM